MDPALATPSSAKTSVRFMAADVGTFVGTLAVVGVLFFVMPGVEVSEIERRQLASFPAFSVDSLAAGDYTRDVDLYVADRFPFREDLVELAFWLRDHRGLPMAAADTEAPAPTVEPTPSVAQAAPPSSPAAPTPAPPDAPPPTAEAPAAAPIVVAANRATPPRRKQVDPTAKLSLKEGFLVLGDRVMQPFHGKLESAKKYADSLNRFVERLGKVRSYAMIVPGAAALYLPERYRRNSKHEPTFIAEAYKHLDPAIGRVDVLSQLMAHADDYIYFRTDHHWTAEGAYWAYQAFAKAAGFEAVPLSGFERRVHTAAYLGTLFGKTRDSKVRKSPDRVEYFVPPVTYTAVAYRKSRPTKASKATFLDVKKPNYS
ncbi:MAG: DHHW family protein, partial [Myxococcota bacterium]|nr:DHHW family protein [Myxococcota bacterium]